MTAAGASGLRRVFVDTSAFFALTDPRDANHGHAQAIRALLVKTGPRLYTSNFVLAETHALMLTRLNRTTALQVLTEIDASNTTIIRVSAADELRARTILRQYGDKDFSLTDATSFAVMMRLGLRDAFSFDRDFAQYGLTVLTG